MPDKTNFAETFQKLKAILQPFESKLVLVHDTDENYYLDTPHVMKNKHRLFFGAVKTGKNYVSFHLMPIYGIAELREKISPELEKRMQGKSCFNFTNPDEKLFKELARLTKSGFAIFTSKKFYSRF